MSDPCLFCTIYSDHRDQIVIEQGYLWTRYDQRPISPGHALIIPKRHVVDLLDLTEAEWAAIQPLIKDMIREVESTDLKQLYEKFLSEKNDNSERARYLKRMLSHPSLGRKPDAYNIGINNGSAAGRTVHHLHIHMIPRYEGDVANPRGGVRNIIPGMGDYTN